MRVRSKQKRKVNVSENKDSFIPYLFIGGSRDGQRIAVEKEDV